MAASAAAGAAGDAATSVAAGATDTPCVLCEHPSQADICVDGHRACYRCGSAYWRATEKVTAQLRAFDSGQDRGQSQDHPIFCFAPDCYQTMIQPTPSPLPGKSTLIPIPENSDEYEQATREFLRTLGATPTIERVFRVNNPTLADMFEMCRANLARETRDTAEKLMFHGTTRTAAGSISRSGFDIRYSGTHGQALGPGIYFAENASYSHGYAEADHGGRQCMIIARVLPGRQAHGRDTERSPNYYDTVSGGDILAVKREQQGLPVYIIYYRT